MKKLIAIILSVGLFWGLTACGGEDAPRSERDGTSPESKTTPNEQAKSEKLVYDNKNKPLGEKEIAGIIPRSILISPGLIPRRLRRREKNATQPDTPTLGSGSGFIVFS